jgi:hypothetical protein
MIDRTIISGRTDLIAGSEEEKWSRRGRGRGRE